MAIAHFVFGAAMTSLVVTFLVPTVRFPRTLVLVGGVWAMVPDVHWISPVEQARLHAFHGTSVWVDAFWFHRTLDRLDPTDSKQVAAVILAFFVVATALCERRAYRAPESLREAVHGDGD